MFSTSLIIFLFFIEVYCNAKPYSTFALRKFDKKGTIIKKKISKKTKKLNRVKSWQHIFDIFY